MNINNIVSILKSYKKYLIIIGIILLVIFYIINLHSRITRLSNEKDQLNSELHQSQATNEALIKSMQDNLNALAEKESQLHNNQLQLNDFKKQLDNSNEKDYLNTAIPMSLRMLLE